MDELVIGEKKYVSSKKAAKLTGYAKDYVGQLCREGRVPARLVGRSWYVLESAIQDHRFGNPTESATEKAKDAPTVEKSWQSPRYEAVDAEVLPSVNRLRESEAAEQAPESGDGELTQSLQKTWQAWFDRFDHISATPASVTMPAREESDEAAATAVPEEEEPEETKDVEIPIRAIKYRPEYLPARAELRVEAEEPHQDDDSGNAQDEEEEGKRALGGHKIRIIIQMAGTLLAIAVASLAVLGSGYLDEYLLSNRQVGIIAGVIQYNK